jgi:hypothetical protein
MNPKDEVHLVWEKRATSWPALPPDPQVVRKNDCHAVELQDNLVDDRGFISPMFCRDYLRMRWGAMTWLPVSWRLGVWLQGAVTPPPHIGMPGARL